MNLKRAYTSLINPSARRQFSQISKIDEAKFPYKFNNTATLIQTNEATKPSGLQVMEQFVRSPGFNLIQGYQYAYESLLSALADGNEEHVRSGLEKSLADAFVSQMQNIQQRGAKLELMNQKHHTFKIEVVDFINSIGIGIDREANRQKGVKEITSFLFDIPNLKIYGPSNPLKMGAALMSLKGGSDPNKEQFFNTITLGLLFKVRTNLKLNLVEADGERMIPKNKETDEEVHYVKFEGLNDKFKIDPANLLKTSQQFEFKDWTITDFDDFLKGNPSL